MKISKVAFVAGIALVLSACALQQPTTVNAGSVGINRVQSFSVESAQVNAFASQEYSKTVEQARLENRLDNNFTQVTRIKNITARLVSKAKFFRPDAAVWGWEAHVFADDELNAFCMPGGKIGIFNGLLTRLNLSDDEVAQILAHEMSHALREHTREQASREQTTGVFANLLGAIGQAYGLNGATEVTHLVAKVGFNLPFSRTHESEADLLGIELAARAGYNPDAAISMWSKMQMAESSSQFTWFSTHPSPDNRQAALLNDIQIVRPLYLAAIHQK